MGWITKMFGTVSKEEMKGLHLETENGFWAIEKIGDLTKFLGALHHIINEDAIIYLEGGSPENELKTFLDAQSMVQVEKIALGTIWPRPLVFHIKATTENIEKLIQISEHVSPFEVAIHCHIYELGHVILEWHDAFTQEILLTRELPLEKIQAFCSDLKLEYKYCKNTECY